MLMMSKSSILNRRDIMKKEPKNKIENNRLEDDIKAGENGSGFKTIDF